MSKRVIMLAAVFSVLLCGFANARDIVKKLPEPDFDDSVPLWEAINNRKSTREFSARKIDDQMLSEILYAAWGISHEAKRTIPTSMNKQNLNVYVIMPNGAWLYDASHNQLTQVTPNDLRPLFNQQDYMTDAQLTLVYTGTDHKNSPLHAGSAYQNVSLYAASKGLNEVVRGYFDYAGVAKALGLKTNEVIISQTIGWPYTH